MVTAVFQRE